MNMKLHLIILIALSLFCTDIARQSVLDLERDRRAEEIVSEMTLEEQIGQMFFARVPEEDAVQSVETYHLGGYILFGRDFQNVTKQQLMDRIQSYQDASRIPMLIGVDEEGGVVNRISTHSQFRSEAFRSPQQLYREGGFDLIRSDTKEKCELLKSLGINVNFAPVCDVSTSSDDYIYRRTFGKDGQHTAQYVSVVVEEMNEQNVGSVLKHFPGYGKNRDTHTGFSYDKTPYATFEENYFLPFLAGIQEGAGSILVSHNVVECIDDQMPASLSTDMHQLIRDELNFDGVIMTDDLSMDAIEDQYGVERAAVLAVLAGNDILLSTHYPQQIAAVKQAVEDGEIAESVIQEAAFRVVRWKLSLGLIQ